MNKLKLIFIDTEYRYGFHVSKLPKLTNTIEYVNEELPYSNFQIYLGNPRSSSFASFDMEDIISSRNLLKKYDLQMFIHGCLMYNLCGSPNHRKDSNFNFNIKNTCDGLTLELDMAVGLDCGGVVVHPNSCHDVKKGIFTACKTIEEVLTRNTTECIKLSKKLGIKPEEFKKKRKLLLENSAHEGGKRGWNLDELSQMIKGIPKELQNQVGVCFDTAHAFGAGIYDFGKIEDIHSFYEEFEEKIGLEHLWLFHLNDSMRSDKKGYNAYFGSHKDRHQNLGLGYIFDDDENLFFSYDGTFSKKMSSRILSLREFFLQARKRNIPIIGETPSAKNGNEGIQDWLISCEILKDTEFPLISG